MQRDLLTLIFENNSPQYRVNHIQLGQLSDDKLMELGSMIMPLVDELSRLLAAVNEERRHRKAPPFQDYVPLDEEQAIRERCARQPG